jgi:ABC-type amino acid transport substrate-binding protein
MKPNRIFIVFCAGWMSMVGLLGLACLEPASGMDLPEIKKAGVLRHLGVPYANFVTGSGDGLDVEMVALFAQHLGVKYEYVMTSWDDELGDLTGKRCRPKGAENVEILEDMPIKGDIVANGLTVLPWRRKVIDYSEPTFPTQIWLIARADLPLDPIVPAGDIERDITLTKESLRGYSILGKADTCLDPSLYHLQDTGAEVRLFGGRLDELSPAIINGDADTTILDVPVALVDLEKWSGKIKVIGPISPRQEMAFGFRKTSPLLRSAFNRFFAQCRKNGTYLNLVRKYYPSVFEYYPDFLGAEK